MRKTTKTLVSLLMAVVMIAALCVPAFAVSNGTIPEKPYSNSEFFHIGDYDLHYRQFKAKGTEKGKIFMIHGFALSSYCWMELVDRLQAKGYTCVVVDQPDFGYSTRETKKTKITLEGKIFGDHYAIYTMIANTLKGGEYVVSLDYARHLTEIMQSIHESADNNTLVTL